MKVGPGVRMAVVGGVVLALATGCSDSSSGDPPGPDTVTDSGGPTDAVTTPDTVASGDEGGGDAAEDAAPPDTGPPACIPHDPWVFDVPPVTAPFVDASVVGDQLDIVYTTSLTGEVVLSRRALGPTGVGAEIAIGTSVHPDAYAEVASNGGSAAVVYETTALVPDAELDELVETPVAMIKAVSDTGAVLLQQTVHHVESGLKPVEARDPQIAGLGGTTWAFTWNDLRRESSDASMVRTLRWERFDGATFASDELSWPFQTNAYIFDGPWPASGSRNRVMSATGETIGSFATDGDGVVAAIRRLGSDGLIELSSGVFGDQLSHLTAAASGKESYLVAWQARQPDEPSAGHLQYARIEGEELTSGPVDAHAFTEATIGPLAIADNSGAFALRWITAETLQGVRLSVAATVEAPPTPIPGVTGQRLLSGWVAPSGLTRVVVWGSEGGAHKVTVVEACPF